MYKFQVQHMLLFSEFHKTDSVYGSYNYQVDCLADKDSCDCTSHLQ